MVRNASAFMNLDHQSGHAPINISSSASRCNQLNVQPVTLAFQLALQHQNVVVHQKGPAGDLSIRSLFSAQAVIRTVPVANPTK
jgi:hypothetical protein